jgi:hypothetical protein
MAVTLPPLPTIPPQPDATASKDQWDVYLRCVSLVMDAQRLEVLDRQAAAYADQAAALARNAAAVEDQLRYLREQPIGLPPMPPMPRPTDEQLFMHYAGQRENAPFADIPSKVRDFAVAMVSAHRAKYPSTPGGENAT